MQRLIIWLEHWFRHQRDVTACLVLSSLPLPLLLMFLLMPWIAAANPQWQAIYNSALLPFCQSVLLLVIAALTGVAISCWRLRRDGVDLPVLALFTVVTVFAGVITLCLGYGYRDSPLIVLCMGMLVLVRALFKPAVYRAVFISMAILFVCSEIAFWTDTFPYAPLLQQPIFVGEQLTPWWAFWLRVIYLMTAVPLVALFFVLAWIMQREKHLLETRVRTDSLTGLFNRREFMARFEIELHRQQRRQKPLCLLLIDIDHFKRINDSWGHPVGDRVLQQIGELLRTSLRRNVDVAARFGGEEFAVLLPYTALPQARAVAEHLSRQLEAIEFGSGGHVFSVTQSVGLVQISGNDADLALRLADENLYAAKQAGRNCVVASVMVADIAAQTAKESAEDKAATKVPDPTV